MATPGELVEITVTKGGEASTFTVELEERE